MIDGAADADLTSRLAASFLTVRDSSLTVGDAFELGSALKRTRSTLITMPLCCAFVHVRLSQ